jgi:predicted amidohydrolase
MSTWKIAGVQMDCKLGEVAHNLGVVREQLRPAVDRGARLVVYPECALTGYAFTSKEEALPFAQPIPGPATDALADDCRALGAYAVVGLLERSGEDLFNACVLVGPDGVVGSYRKIHLPVLGVDRFATPGDRPFAVQEIDGLRVGMNICFDGSFPESSRILTLLGADLIVLPTNWPTKAVKAATLLAPARALENHVYYAGVNRVGEERGYHFIGRSCLIDFGGDVLAAGGGLPEIVTAEIDPARARAKRIVHVPGEYEVDRVGQRRPEMYGVLTEGKG